MARPQVPPGTRNARTGAYIRKPVRVTGGGGKKPPKVCLCMVMAFAGGVGWLVYDAVSAVLPYDPWARWM